ncbi:MAG: hypothetical protein KJ964_05575 [Verrucomicrobia bacterium]|nr:hypothetical protein [Verrucomicrobiota bacterium]MBU1736389.1 hypothetical protein [Verrucomicrobiota bacterium]MBU1855464.1 hypothetical protein [Verrucomicrobiota bacterium]
MTFISPILTDDDTTASWPGKREDIFKRVMNIVGEPPVTNVSHQATIVDEQDCGSYVRRKITYLVEADERIPAWLLVPKKAKKPVPAILCLHGTNKQSGKDTVVGIPPFKPGRNHGHELAERGYVVFAIDDIVMGERGRNIERLDTSGFYRRYPDWSVVGKMVWDYGRGMDYLSTLDFVASGGFGAIGHSLGATTILFLAALDSRISASVVSCGWGTCCKADPRRKSLGGEKEGDYSRLIKLREIFLEEKEAPFDFHELIALIAPRALLRISAYTDEYVKRPDVIAESSLHASRVYKLLGYEENFAQYFHGDLHNFEPVTRALAYAWLDKHLKEVRTSK